MEWLVGVALLAWLGMVAVLLARPLPRESSLELIFRVPPRKRADLLESSDLPRTVEGAVIDREDPPCP